MTGKYYMPVRSLSRETCFGTSDNVLVPMEEFKHAMDGAMRLARSFDDGLSECGFICPGSILSMDPNLDPYYTTVDQRVPPPILDFPCY